MLGGVGVKGEVVPGPFQYTFFIFEPFPSEVCRENSVLTCLKALDRYTATKKLNIHFMTYVLKLLERRGARTRRPTALWSEAKQANSIMTEGNAGKQHFFAAGHAGQSPFCAGHAGQSTFCAGQQQYGRRQRRPTALWQKAAQANSIFLPQANLLFAAGHAGQSTFCGGSAGQKNYGRRQRRPTAL